MISNQINIKVIIVEDNLAFLRSFEAMVEQIEPLELLCSCSGIEHAYAAIEALEPDLVFLDVQLHDGNAFDLLARFEKQNFEVVIITAHIEYAINAISWSVLHYLLKPFGKEQIHDVVRRYLKKHNYPIDNQKTFQGINHGINMSQKLRLDSLEEMNFVDFDEIVYCKSDNNYTTFFLHNQNRITVSTTLKKYELILEKSHFLRVHQSYLVNLMHVQKLSYKDGLILYLTNNVMLPVSRRKRKKLVEVLSVMSIH
jgi:two-component system, LytTR family, response regulator